MAFDLHFLHIGEPAYPASLVQEVHGIHGCINLEDKTLLFLACPALSCPVPSVPSFPRPTKAPASPAPALSCPASRGAVYWRPYCLCCFAGSSELIKHCHPAEGICQDQERGRSGRQGSGVAGGVPGPALRPPAGSRQGALPWHPSRTASILLLQSSFNAHFRMRHSTPPCIATIRRASSLCVSSNVRKHYAAVVLQHGSHRTSPLGVSCTVCKHCAALALQHGSLDLGRQRPDRHSSCCPSLPSAAAEALLCACNPFSTRPSPCSLCASGCQGHQGLHIQPEQPWV